MISTFNEYAGLIAAKMLLHFQNGCTRSPGHESHSTLRGYAYLYDEEERKPPRQNKSDVCKQQCDDEAALEETRKKLVDYKFGDMSKDPETLHTHVTQLRIALFGGTGSGKSCLINTCERAVRGAERGFAESSSEEESTVTLQDHLPQMFFHLVDTRGFFNFDSNETDEFQNILLGKIQPGDTIDRPTNGQTSQQKLHQFPAFEKRVHGIIIVVKANDPRLQEGTLKEYLQPFREIICNNGNFLTYLCRFLDYELYALTGKRRRKTPQGQSWQIFLLLIIFRYYFQRLTPQQSSLTMTHFIRKKSLHAPEEKRQKLRVVPFLTHSSLGTIPKKIGIVTLR